MQSDSQTSEQIADPADSGIFSLYFPGTRKYICACSADTFIFAIARFFSRLIILSHSSGYGNRIRVKYTAKWGVQIAGMIFQTHSRPAYLFYSIFINYCCSQKNRIRLSYPALAFHFLFFHIFLPNQAALFPDR